MRMIREILRLHYSCSLSNRKISKALGCSRWAVDEYIRRAETANLGWPLSSEFDDEDKLEALLYLKEPTPIDKQRPQPDCNYIHQELKKKGVTLDLLWQEYKQEHPNGYQLSQFRNIYRDWRKTVNLSMRQNHKAGEKAFSDFAGKTLPITNPHTGEITQAHLFVCSLGASSYTYAKLFFSENTEAWATGHALAFTYFGGCPNIIVPDNPKPVITKACRYEPDVNPSFAQMANHFNLAIIPARVRHPKDKAVVESAVGLTTRWILAVLRKQTFFSLAEANQAVAELLEKLNNKPFKKLPGTRRSRFETVDKPALKPLPDTQYEYMHIKYATVHIADYHVEYDGSWYSAPYQYRGRTVEARATLNTIEIYLKGKRIASHPRGIIKGSRSTLDEHRPKSHREYGQWPPERITRWAATIGPATKDLTEKILQSKKHPELGYRTCFGILRLAKSVGNNRLESACQRALSFNACSLRSVKSILDSGLDRCSLPEKPRQLKIIHTNIRGANAFSTLHQQEDNNVDSSNNR
jgi:transposase